MRLLFMVFLLLIVAVGCGDSGASDPVVIVVTATPPPPTVALPDTITVTEYKHSASGISAVLPGDSWKKPTTLAPNGEMLLTYPVYLLFSHQHDQSFVPRNMHDLRVVADAMKESMSPPYQMLDTEYLGYQAVRLEAFLKGDTETTFHVIIYIFATSDTLHTVIAGAEEAQWATGGENYVEAILKNVSFNPPSNLSVPSNTKPQASETPVTLYGQGTKNTEPFYLAGGNYKILWVASDASGSGVGCFFSGYLKAVDPSVIVLESVGNATVKDRKGGTTYAYSLKRGQYYFDVNSGCDWTLTMSKQ